jgi:hypothetical protein
LIFCDIDANAERAAAPFGEFYQGSVENLSEKYPQAPIISDAVKSVQTGAGASRATHCYMADNLHQLDLLLMKRPFVIAKLFAPFGEAVEGVSVSLVMRELLGNDYFASPALARHNTEFVVLKSDSIKGVHGMTVAQIIANSFAFEDARQFFFELEATPSESALKRQYQRIDRYPALKLLHVDVVEARRPKIVTAPAPVKEPELTALEKFRRRKEVAIPQSPASKLVMPPKTGQQQQWVPKEELGKNARDLKASVAAVDRKKGGWDSEDYALKDVYMKKFGMPKEVAAAAVNAARMTDTVKELLVKEQAATAPLGPNTSAQPTDLKMPYKESTNRRMIGGKTASDIRSKSASRWPMKIDDLIQIGSKMGLGESEVVDLYASYAGSNSTITKVMKEEMFARGDFTSDDMLEFARATLCAGDDLYAYYCLMLCYSMIVKDNKSHKFTLNRANKLEMQISAKKNVGW